MTAKMIVARCLICRHSCHCCHENEFRFVLTNKNQHGTIKSTIKSVWGFVDMNKNIESLFKKNNGFLKAADLYSAGATRKAVSSMLECGDIVRIKRGYYQFASMDEPNEAAMIVKLFPEAILCMDTALFHYGYSDRTPLEWNMAVSRGISKSRFNLTYPFIKPYYIDDKHLNIGVSKEIFDGIKVKIYDRERVICDCLKHKNKMDSEMFGKAIQAYLNEPKKNIKNLAVYAKHLRVYKKAQDLIGVWL